MKRFVLPLALSLAGAACTSSDGYPSLLPRATERTGFAEPTAPAPPAAAPDPALDARIASARRRLDAATARFNAAALKGDGAVERASGAAAGSDRWLDAQTALADLDVLRAETLEGLSDLERLASERAGTLTSDYLALDDAIETARKLADDQAKRIAALQAMLTPA